MIKCEWTVFGSRQVTPKLWPPASDRWPSALKRQASAFDHKPWPAKHQSWCVGVLLQTFGLRPARVFPRPVAFGLWPSVFSLRPWVVGLRQSDRSSAFCLCRSSQRACGLLFFCRWFSACGIRLPEIGLEPLGPLALRPCGPSALTTMKGNAPARNLSLRQSGKTHILWGSVFH